MEVKLLYIKYHRYLNFLYQVTGNGWLIWKSPLGNKMCYFLRIWVVSEWFMLHIGHQITRSVQFIHSLIKNHLWKNPENIHISWKKAYLITFVKWCKKVISKPLFLLAPLSVNSVQCKSNHFVKSFQIWSYFWSAYRKIRTRNNSVFEHFSCSGANYPIH